MKAKRILSLSVVLTLLVALSFLFIPAATKAKMSECERVTLKYKPEVQTFKADYANAPFENMFAALENSDSDIAAQMKFAVISAEKKRAVWQKHLESADLRTFSQEQTDFIENTISNVLPNFQFDGRDDIEKIRAFRNEAFRVFTKADAKKLFGSLRPTLTLMRASASAGRCNCSRIDDWCDEQYVCIGADSGMWQCSPSTWGCGLFWIEPCNGMCV
jgi:hypothetical protein